MLFEGIGWRVVLFIMGVAASTFLTNTVLRQIFGVERKPFFSKNEVYEDQKKWDRILKGISVVAAISVPMLLFEYGAASLYVLLVSVVIGAVQLGVQASFQKKHAENPYEYMYTLLESLTTTVIFIAFGISLFPEFLEYVYNL
ncbi:DUF4181 domain-containing protein [Planococcus soli]|uniref:DUF4181 domain-containing protein n=1 Tax=Planococcus soli TaxID=2666072 RepID=UPI00115CA051|nr:DUF4181 domain-containing protein [Planococcus soli]